MHLGLGRPWTSAQHLPEPVSPRTPPHPWWSHRHRSSLSAGTAGSRGSSAAARAGGRRERPPLIGKGARTCPERSQNGTCHREGRAGSSTHGLGYCAHLSQQLWEAQDLCKENPQADEDAGHEAQETPQVLGGDFSQVEGYHAETDTWGEQEGPGWKRQWGEGCPARSLVHFLPCPAPSTAGTRWPVRWPCPPHGEPHCRACGHGEYEVFSSPLGMGWRPSHEERAMHSPAAQAAPT